MTKTDFDAWTEMLDAQGILYEVDIDKDIDLVMVYPKTPTGRRTKAICFDQKEGYFIFII